MNILTHEQRLQKFKAESSTHFINIQNEIVDYLNSSIGNKKFFYNYKKELTTILKPLIIDFIKNLNNEYGHYILLNITENSIVIFIVDKDEYETEIVRTDVNTLSSYDNTNDPLLQFHKERLAPPKIDFTGKSDIFTQFRDELYEPTINTNKIYIMDTMYSYYDTGLNILHKLCLFPPLLKKYLQNNELNVNQLNCTTNTYQFTPLMLVLRNEIEESLKLLIDYINDKKLPLLSFLNFEDKYGYTALYYSGKIKLLLKYIPENLVATVVDYTGTKGHNYTNTIDIEKIKLLISYNIIKDKWLLEFYNNEEILKLLLEQAKNNNISININIQDSYKNTPLILACNKVKCVELLLQYGANVNILNNFNKSALQYAYENKNEEIIKLLLNHNTPEGNKELVTKIFPTTATNILKLLLKYIE